MSNKTFEGTVLSNKMTKTIVVRVTRKFKETRTHKIVSSNKKYKVHSENPAVREGDIVSFIECRPISKEKKFRLLTIIKKAESLDNSTVDEPS